jgi:hypothetical protein
MSFKLSGKLIFVGDPQQVTEKFRKREFVIETSEEVAGSVYTNYVKFQLVNNKCDLLNDILKTPIGSNVDVDFTCKGSRYEKDGKTNYITNLDAWRIATAGGASNTSAPAASAPQATTQQQGNGNTTFYNPAPEAKDDLPF